MRLAVALALLVLGCSSSPSSLPCYRFTDSCLCAQPAPVGATTIATCDHTFSGGATCCMDTVHDACSCTVPSLCGRVSNTECSCGPAGALEGTMVATCTPPSPGVCCLGPPGSECLCTAQTSCGPNTTQVSSCTGAMIDGCDPTFMPVSSCS